MAGRAPGGRRRRRRLQVGLPLRRRLADGRRRPRGQGPLARGVRASSGAQTRRCWAGGWLVYHVHSATLETGVLDDAAVHRALAGLRAQGVRVGISTSGPAQADAVRRALEVTVDGEPLFTSFQSTWNVLEPSAGPALAEAAAGGARVIVKEAVANGRLAPGGADTPGARRAAELAARAGRAGGPAGDRRGAGAAVGVAGAVRARWTRRQVASNAAAAELDRARASPGRARRRSPRTRPPTGPPAPPAPGPDPDARRSQPQRDRSSPRAPGCTTARVGTQKAVRCHDAGAPSSGATSEVRLAGETYGPASRLFIGR